VGQGGLLMMVKTNLFIYGSLKQGESNYCVMQDLDGKYLGPAHTKEKKWSVIDLGCYPGLVPGDFYVDGELFEIENHILEEFDIFESVPVLYKRIEIPIICEVLLSHERIAFTYQYNTLFTLRKGDDSKVRMIDDVTQSWGRYGTQ